MNTSALDEILQNAIALHEVRKTEGTANEDTFAELVACLRNAIEMYNRDHAWDDVSE